MINAAAGYDPNLVAQLDPAHQRSLALANLWCGISIMACGASFGLFAWQLGHAPFPSLVAGGVFGVMLGLLGAYGSASLMRSMTGSGPDPRGSSGARWFLAVLLAGVGVLMTQPFLMWYLGPQNIDGVMRPLDIEKMRAVAAAQREVTSVQHQLGALQDLVRSLPGAESSPVLRDGGREADQVIRPDSKRRALIMVNGAYRKVSPLSGPLQDGARLRAALERLGFTVQMESDGTNVSMERALETFRKSLNPNDVSLLFYSGHGVQFRGSNYLVPVDMSPDVSRIPSDGIGLSRAVEAISSRRPRASIVLIDACRADPTGATGGGLAPIEAGTNTYIALAAQPNQVALEERAPGGRAEGLFTAALLKHIGEPEDIDAIFRKVNRDVQARSLSLRPGQDAQRVSIQHNLKSELFLADGSAGLPEASAAGQAVNVQVAQYCGMPARVADTPEARAEMLRCLESNWLRLEDDFRSADQKLRQATTKPVSLDLSEKHVILTYRSVWDRPMKPLVFTVLLAIAMAGGFVLRAALGAVHEAYAHLLHAIDRSAVADFAHQAMRRAVSYRLPVPEAAIRPRFFDRLEPPPALEVANASPDELMADLLGDRATS